MPPLQRIVLTGFMGSGKTTVGSLLASRLRWAFLDLDHELERHEGISVPEIFARHGEVHFRNAETSALRALLDRSACVIALGGGAVETPAVQALLAGASETAVVHLDSPFDPLFDRCFAQAQDPSATHRPLLGERAAAAQRYIRRQPLYQLVSHHAVHATHPPAAVADEILALLARKYMFA